MGQDVEIHDRECRPPECVPSCAHYRAPSAPEREPDLIDNCFDCAKLIFDAASAPPVQPDKAAKAGGWFSTALRLLGVGEK